MIDAGTENINPRLILIEGDFKGFNLYQLGTQVYAVPGLDPTYKMPLPTKENYTEYLVGPDLESAKSYINANAQLGK